MRRPRCLGNMNSWRTFFRRPSFVLQTKILYCETTITLKISFWCQKLSQFVRNFFLKIKPKMRDVLGKMRECGKYVKMRDFPHDCGRVDTYEWVSVVKRLKRKTKHGSQALLMWCVSVTSPIRITDRLNHSESNIDLHKSEYKCIVLAVCHV